LDEVGLGEAERLGAMFSAVPLALVVTSPLARAYATGAPIARSRGLTLEVDERLVDRDYGPFTGLPPEEAGLGAGQLTASRPGVEAAGSVVARAGEALREVAARLADGQPRAGVVVAHDVVNRLVLAALVPELGVADGIPQRTGCWNQLEHGPGGWRAVVVDALP
jgi:broad specificity phosphatase PhoE